MSTELTTTEQAQLERCESVIQGGLQTFIEVGNALCEIRDSRLYKQHGTFEEYCLSRWQMTPQSARRLIRSGDVVANLEPMGSIPTNERQARPLTKLDTPEQQREAWTEAVEQSGGKPTAKDVATDTHWFVKNNAESSRVVLALLYTEST